MDRPAGKEADVPRSGELLREADFLLFVAARGGGVFGVQFVTVAVGWHVYTMTGRVFDLGLVGLSQFLPVLLLFLLAGLVADRFDRRIVVGTCYGIHAIAAGLLGAYLLGGGSDVLPVFALLSLHGSARGFLHPATQAILPNIVPRTLFSNAVAIAGSVNKVGQLAGPALGGILVAWIDEWTYFAAALLFALSAIAAICIRSRLALRGIGSFGLATVLGGFDYIWRKKVVLGAITIDLVAVLFGGVMGLLPVFAADILQVGPDMLGIMRAAPAAGALIVALGLARGQLPCGVGTAFFLSLGVFGTAILVFSISTSFWLSVAALAVYGAADMVSVYIRQTLVQIETPDHLRGRVSAVNSVAVNASNELGDFRAGSMGALVGTVPAVFAGAVMTLFATALWWRLFPDLRRIARL